jgi:hypothetical protein
MIFGDAATLPESRCDFFRAFRVLDPTRRIGRRINSDDTGGSDAELAQRLGDPAGFFDLFDKTMPFLGLAHGRPATRGRPDRSNY